MIIPGYLSDKGNRPEWNHMDMENIQTFNISSIAPLVQHLNQVAQGTGEDERIGREYTIGSINFRAVITPTDSSTSFSHVRLALIWDKQPNGSLPLASHIFDDGGNPMGFAELDNKYRFKILCDKHYLMDRRSTSAPEELTSKNQHLVEFYKRLNIRVRHSGVTGTIDSIVNGALLLLVSCDAATGDGVDVNYSSRIRFKE